MHNECAFVFSLHYPAQFGTDANSGLDGQGEPPIYTAIGGFCQSNGWENLILGTENNTNINFAEGALRSRQSWPFSFRPRQWQICRGWNNSPGAGRYPLSNLTLSPALLRSVRALRCYSLVFAD